MPRLTPADVERRLEDIDMTTVLAQHDRQSLLGKDGAAIYAPPEHARRDLVVLARFDDELAEHEGAAEEATRTARDELDLIENADPRGLDDFDNDADVTLVVSTWLPIAERDVQTMPAGDLETRCRTLVARGDRRRISAYAIAVRGRVDSLRRQYGDGDQVDVPPALRTERNNLAAIGQLLETALVPPQREAKRLAAQHQLDLALQLRRKISAASEKVHAREKLSAAARSGGPLGCASCWPQPASPRTA